MANKQQFACHQDGPPGPLTYWNCRWEEKELGIEKDFELMGMEKRRLLRLRPDYKDESNWRPTTRVEFMTIVAREALRTGHCEVVGGFLRDWIIRGDDDKENGTPKDIDLRLWEGFDMDGFIKRCSAWGLRRDDRNVKLGFLTPKDEWFIVDYITTEQFEKGGLLPIDLDVNSFAVSPDKGLHKRAYVNRPVCKTYGNMKRKYAYLVNTSPENNLCNYMKERVAKMQRRGWKVIRAECLDENCKDCAF